MSATNTMTASYDIRVGKATVGGGQHGGVEV